MVKTINIRGGGWKETSTHQPTARKRLDWLDATKGVGILLVVFGHVYHNTDFYSFVYSFHMPLFFLAAGWLYREKEILPNIRHRLFTIMLPYFFFGSLCVLYWWFVERHFRSIDMTFPGAVLGLCSGEYDYLGFNVHLWFLPCFFTTVVIYNILRKCTNRTITYIVAFILSVVYVLNVLPSLPWGLDWVCKYIAFYAIGNALAGVCFDQKMKQPLAWVVAIILLVGVLTLSLHHLTSGVMWFVTGTCGTLSVMTFCLIRPSNTFLTHYVCSPLQYLGRISLVILCCHGPIYRAISKVLSMPLHTTTEELRVHFLYVCVIVVLTVLICATIYQLLATYLPWAIGKKK